RKVQQEMTVPQAQQVCKVLMEQLIEKMTVADWVGIYEGAVKR
ncbi:MAG: hypothetical protein ACI8QH_001344, partial [Flammeovirgaceae bacterium]